MQKYFTPILAIAGLLIVFILIPTIMTGAHGIVSDSQIDTFTGTVDSGTPNYNATVTLTEDLYDDLLSYAIVTTVSGTGTDTPTLGTWVPASGSITVSGLNANAPGTTTHNITITYDCEAVDDYVGLEDVVKISPLIIFVFALFSGAAIGVHKYRSRNNNSMY